MPGFSDYDTEVKEERKTIIEVTLGDNVLKMKKLIKPEMPKEEQEKIERSSLFAGVVSVCVYILWHFRSLPSIVMLYAYYRLFLISIALLDGLPWKAIITTFQTPLEEENVSFPKG